jgi:hypothetical protein
LKEEKVRNSAAMRQLLASDARARGADGSIGRDLSERELRRLIERNHPGMMPHAASALSPLNIQWDFLGSVVETDRA